MASGFRFGPIPFRALGDTRLSSLEVRLLSAIGYHDRLSIQRGKGAGCWAGNQKLADTVKCRLDSLSAAITVLVELGYVTREPHPINKRLRVYRVVPDSDDRATAQSSVPQDDRAAAHQSPAIIGQPKSYDAETNGKSGVEYIPLKREDILHKQEQTSVETAPSLRSAGLRNSPASNAGGFLAIVERELIAGAPLDAITAKQIERIAEERDSDDPVHQHAERILNTWSLTA